MKQYKLLKDTPQGKRGTVIQQKEEGKPYWPIVKEGIWSRVAEIENIFAANLVENNPEWFEEIKDKGRIFLEYRSPFKEIHQSFLCKKTTACPSFFFTDKEIILMGAALNGELFTEKEMFYALKSTMRSTKFEDTHGFCFNGLIQTIKNSRQ